jgi:DNA polymerase I
MIYLDIETTLAHDKIWCCVLKEGDEFTVFTTREGLQDRINKATQIAGHNIIGFDAPVLYDVWDIEIPHEKLVDTLILSRMALPERRSHSLAAWGETLGYEKGDFTDYDAGFSQEMLEYCQRDVEVLEKLYERLQMHLHQFPANCVAMEYKVASIIKKQEQAGFKLDIQLAITLCAEFKYRMDKMQESFQILFPPIVIERYSEVTGKRLKDNIEVFNPSSRQQIYKRLTELGAKFTKQTEKGNPIVDEGELKKIDLPEAKEILEYLLLNKRYAQVRGWRKWLKLDRKYKDNRVHGRVITCGTVTGRMSHLDPNVAQVPSVKSEFGKECRECWTVEKGNVLVGADASGLELRMLAHYMNDENYTKELLDGDIHTANQKAAKLQTRDQAKTFIYAFLYGAGPAKIGQIVGGDYRHGKKMIDEFLRNTPALAILRQKVAAQAKCGYLRGLDGRRLLVRSEHSALNTLLQSAGAIAMKQALVELDRKLTEAGIPCDFVANVHDEWQIEAPEFCANQLGELAVEAIREMSLYFNMNCPLDAEYKIGKTWAETH